MQQHEFQKQLQRNLGSVSVSATHVQRYAAPAVESMLLRGDVLLADDAWEAAEHCYLGAYFCNGGQGPVIRAKIELVQQLLNVGVFTNDVSTRIESARFTPSVLKEIFKELQRSETEIRNLRTELPNSAALERLEGQVIDTLLMVHEILKQKR